MPILAEQLSDEFHLSVQSRLINLDTL